MESVTETEYILVALTSHKAVHSCITSLRVMYRNPRGRSTIQIFVEMSGDENGFSYLHIGTHSPVPFSYQLVYFFPHSFHFTDILMYMDRTYVNQRQKTPVHELGLKLWRDHVVRNTATKTRLLKTLQELVYQERTGEAIDRGLIRSITQMLMDLGQAVYQDDFEKPFLGASADFYKVRANLD